MNVQNVRKYIFIHSAYKTLFMKTILGIVYPVVPVENQVSGTANVVTIARMASHCLVMVVAKNLHMWAE